MDKVLELKSQLNTFLFSKLNEDSLKQNLKGLLVEELKNTIKLKNEELFKGENYRIVRNGIKINLYKTFKAENFKNDLTLFVDNNLKSLENSSTTLESIISPAVVNGIKVYVFNHKDDLIDNLKKFLNSENIDEKMYEEINKVLNSINPMVSRFVNTNNIFNKIKTSINDYLDNPKNIMDIVNMINTQLDSVMKKRVSEFASYFPAESRSSLANSISKSVIDNILSEKFIDMILNKLEGILYSLLNSIDENSEYNLIDFDNIMQNFVENLYTKVLSSDKSKELIAVLSDSIVDNILSKPLISFIES